MPKPVALHTLRSWNIIVTQVCKEGELGELIIFINLLSTDFSVA